MTNSTERKGLLQFGSPDTQQNNSTQTRAPWTNVYKRGPDNNPASSNNYRPKSPIDYRGTNRTIYEPRQSSQFQEQNYQRRTSPTRSTREPEAYPRRTRPNYSLRGSGHFQQRRPQTNFYQGGLQVSPNPQYHPGYMMPYQYYTPPYSGYFPPPMPTPMQTPYAQNQNNSFRQNLNSSAVHQKDAPMNQQNPERPLSVKFISAEDFGTEQAEEQPCQQ